MSLCCSVMLRTYVTTYLTPRLPSPSPPSPPPRSTSLNQTFTSLPPSSSPSSGSRSSPSPASTSLSHRYSLPWSSRIAPRASSIIAPQSSPALPPHTLTHHLVPSSAPTSPISAPGPRPPLRVALGSQEDWQQGPISPLLRPPPYHLSPIAYRLPPTP